MTAGNYQVRERLIDMVGAVSARLGRLLELSPELEDRDRLLVNRLASDIAALQSSVLEAIYSNRVTSPHSLRELHDLESGALVTLDKLETYISATLRQRMPASAQQSGGPHQPYPAAAAWDMPSAPRSQPRSPSWHPGVVAEPPWPQGQPHPPRQSDLDAWPGTDARYIDVAYEPVAQPVQEAAPFKPTPLVPQDLAGSEFEAYGDALRRAVSSFKTHETHRTAAPPFSPSSGAGHASAVAVPQQPSTRAMVPAVLNRAGAQDVEDAETASRFDQLRALPKQKAVMALLGVCAFVMGAWVFASDDQGGRKAPPVVMAKVNPRMEPLSPPAALGSPPGGQAASPALPAAALDGAGARGAPLSPGRPRDLFVAVVATMATRDGIEQKVEDLKSRYPHLVDAGAKAGIEPVIGADGRQWYRAFLLPGRSQTAVRDFCREIREAGYMLCWAKRLSRPSS